MKLLLCCCLTLISVIAAKNLPKLENEILKNQILPSLDEQENDNCTNAEDGTVVSWNCNEYEYCEEGVVLTQNCLTQGLVYNRDSQRCENASSTGAPCGTNRDEACSQAPDGRYADLVRNCLYFYTCLDNRYLGSNACSPGTVFDEAKCLCNFEFDVYAPCGSKQDDGNEPDTRGCSLGYSEILQEKVKETEEKVKETEEKVKETEQVQEEVKAAVQNTSSCEGQEDGTVIEWDCTQYTYCEEEKPRIEDCFWKGLVYDLRTQSCDNVTEAGPPCGTNRDQICEVMVDGRFADWTRNCLYFYTCENGAYSGTQPCGPGTVFDEKNCLCNFAADTYAPCGTKPDDDDKPQERGCPL